MLIRAREKACELESAIFDKFKSDAQRQEKFRSLCYALFMKYTEFKVLLLSGELTVSSLIEMSPKDFLSEEERQRQAQMEQDIRDS